jgi:hypothetical protein
MELTKSLKAYFYDKTTSPLYSTIIVSWCLWNWRIFYVTFFISESVIYNKLEFIESNLIGWGVSLVYPLASAIFIITVVPWISNGVKLLTLWYELRLKEKVVEKEKSSLLTVEESIALRLEIENEKIRFYQSMSSKDKDLEGQRKTIETLSGQIASLNKDRINYETGIKILRAEYGLQGAFIDVKDKLNSMIKDHSLEINVNNETFGDPKPGELKQLTMIYIHDGTYHFKVMNEGEKHLIINAEMNKAILDFERRNKIESW